MKSVVGITNKKALMFPKLPEFSKVMSPFIDFQSTERDQINIIGFKKIFSK